MEVNTKKVVYNTVTITLTDSEAKYLVEQHAEHGSEHFPINHSFCYDRNCTSCRIVKAVREALK